MFNLLTEPAGRAFIAFPAGKTTVDLPARFVGHPVLESGAGQGDAERFFGTHKILRNATPVVILPGSRVTETSRLMPVFRETMARLQFQIPNLVPVLAAAPGIAEAASAMVADWPVDSAGRWKRAAR